MKSKVDFFKKKGQHRNVARIRKDLCMNEVKYFLAQGLLSIWKKNWPEYIIKESDYQGILYIGKEGTKLFQIPIENFIGLVAQYCRNDIKYQDRPLLYIQCQLYKLSKKIPYEKYPFNSVKKIRIDNLIQETYSAYRMAIGPTYSDQDEIIFQKWVNNNFQKWEY